MAKEAEEKVGLLKRKEVESEDEPNGVPLRYANY